MVCKITLFRQLVKKPSTDLHPARPKEGLSGIGCSLHLYVHRRPTPTGRRKRREACTVFSKLFSQTSIRCREGCPVQSRKARTSDHTWQRIEAITRNTLCINRLPLHLHRLCFRPERKGIRPRADSFPRVATLFSVLGRSLWKPWDACNLRHGPPCLFPDRHTKERRLLTIF